jgi:hypothetical protein
MAGGEGLDAAEVQDVDEEASGEAPAPRFWASAASAIKSVQTAKKRDTGCLIVRGRLTNDGSATRAGKPTEPAAAAG